MEEPTTYYNDLISRYFAGEASEQEITDLSLWLQADEAHVELFEGFRKSWLAVERASLERNMDVDAEWEKFSEKCFEADRPQGKTFAVDFSPKRSRSLLLRIAAVAAVLIVLAVSSILAYKYMNPASEVSVIAGTDNLERLLPDGSQVTLSPGTTFSYPEQFKGSSRQVRLDGEAYFEVSHDPSKPFIVSAGEHVRVEVLGTTFYVNTHNDEGKVEVVLINGKVAVYDEAHPESKLILLPGEKTEVSPAEFVMSKSTSTDQNYLAWKTGKLVFAETRLDEVVRLLNKTYHADVRLADPALGSCTITATFNNQSLESVMTVIKETLSLEVHKQGKTTILSGPACQ
jgi:ferric-dicitrate binding protein FerR (iron transport regulator)